MPNSNDNQDYGEKNNKTNQKPEANKAPGKGNEMTPEFTSDNLKGKKVDADPEKPSDQPADL